jgi:hypothetical protein
MGLKSFRSEVLHLLFWNLVLMKMKMMRDVGFLEFNRGVDFLSLTKL